MTTWDPAYDQDAGLVKIISADINASLFAAVFSQPFLPMIVTPMSEWLMDDAGIVLPPTPVYSVPRSHGRGFPQ